MIICVSMLWFLYCVLRQLCVAYKHCAIELKNKTNKSDNMKTLENKTNTAKVGQRKMNVEKNKLCVRKVWSSPVEMEGALAIYFLLFMP